MAQVIPIHRNENDHNKVTAEHLQANVNFEWTALDDPSEMTYEPHISCCCLIFMGPFLPFLPLIYYNHVNTAKSQKIMITDTHVIYERNGCCCCYCFSTSQPNWKALYRIDLNNIRSIENLKISKYLKLNYLRGTNERASCTTFGESYILMNGFNKSSETPMRITDNIIQRRPKKVQTTSYTIPYITSSSTYNTICLNPDTLTIDFKESERVSSCSFLYDTPERTDITAFLDSLGSIDKGNKNCVTSSPRLLFWSPPVGRPRGGSGDAPDMIAYFSDDNSCTEFKIAAESSRDSFKLDNS
jgi:hypothetical protein